MRGKVEFSSGGRDYILYIIKCNAGPQSPDPRYCGRIFFPEVLNNRHICRSITIRDFTAF